MNLKRYIFTLFICLLTLGEASSQESLIPLNDDYEMEIQAAAYNSAYRFHTSVKSWSEYQFKDIINIDSLNKSQFIVKKFNRKWKNYAWLSINLFR